jgi:hypothetical protein
VQGYRDYLNPDEIIPMRRSGIKRIIGWIGAR